MSTSTIPAMLSHLPINPGVTEEVIADTQRLIGYELPGDLLDFYRACDGADNTAYATIPKGTPHIRLDPMGDWVTNSDAYDFASWKLVMLGSDGGPFAYCLSLKSLPMQYRQIDFGDTGQGQYLGSSFAEFLEAVRDERKPKAPKTTEKPKPLPPPAKDKPFAELKGFPNEVTAMALSPSGLQVLACSYGTPFLFDVKTRKPAPIATPGENEYFCPAVGWLGERPVLVKWRAAPRQPSGLPDPSGYAFWLVDGSSSTELCRLEGCSDPGCGRGESAEFSPDGTRFAYSNGRGQFFGDPHAGKRLATLPGAANDALALAWSPDGSVLAVGRQGSLYPPEGDVLLNPDWKVLFLDRDGKECAKILCVPEDDPFYHRPNEYPGVSQVQFNASGNRFLLVRAGVVHIHAMDGAIPSPQPVIQIKVPMRKVHTACFAGDERLAVTTLEGEIMLYSLETGKPIRKWQSTKLQGGLITATRDGKLLLTANGPSETGSGSKSIRIWKVDV